MRITTQMLNKSARMAGLPVNRTTLMNYINGTSNQNNSLLSALSKTKSADRTAKKTGYEKLQKSADQLYDKAGNLAATGETSLLAQAEKSGDYQKVYDALESFTGQYNDTVKALKDASGTLNDYYRQSLKDLADGNQEILEAIGVTFKKDGTMGIDKDKLKDADADTLKNVFGKSQDFFKKASFLAGRISDNAQTNQNSLSSQYSSQGLLYSALANKYNFRG